MKQLFLDISTAIETVEAMRWVDFDLGQLENPDTQGVSYPCALISFSAGTFIDTSNDLQQGELTINIRLAFNVHERTHSKTKAARRTVGLAHLDIIKLVHNQLQGLSGEDYEPLTRSGFTTEPRADYRVYALTYSATVNDDLTDPEDENPNVTTYQPWSDLRDDLNFCHNTEIE